jgi:hypothetical protein
MSLEARPLLAFTQQCTTMHNRITQISPTPPIFLGTRLDSAMSSPRARGLQSGHLRAFHQPPASMKTTGFSLDQLDAAKRERSSRGLAESSMPKVQWRGRNRGVRVGNCSKIRFCQQHCGEVRHKGTYVAEDEIGDIQMREPVRAVPVQLTSPCCRASLSRLSVPTRLSRTVANRCSRATAWRSISTSKKAA